MTELPEGWDVYDPDDHDRSADPAYRRARAAAAEQADRRRAVWGEALAALRRARSLTQVALAEQLGVAQGEVSRIEHQADLLLSTLARYVEGMGGELTVKVRFGGGEPVEVGVDLHPLTGGEAPAEVVVPSDLAVVTTLAGFLGRYDTQEARFRAAVSA